MERGSKMATVCDKDSYQQIILFLSDGTYVETWVPAFSNTFAKIQVINIQISDPLYLPNGVSLYGGGNA